MPTKPCTILLAEDDPDDLILFREAVSMLGNTVNLIEADNGQATLDLLRTSDAVPDFIVLDVNMPRIPGIDCLRMIRSDKRFAEIPAVVMSTSADEETIAKAKDAGATKYAIKPGSFNELAAIVRYMCEQWLKRPLDDEFILNETVRKHQSIL